MSLFRRFFLRKNVVTRKLAPPFPRKNGFAVLRGSVLIASVASLVPIFFKIGTWLAPLFLLFREKSRGAPAIRAGRPPSCTPPLAFRLFASTPPSAASKLVFAPTLFLTKKRRHTKACSSFPQKLRCNFCGVLYASLRLRRLFMLRKKAVVWLTPLLLLFPTKAASPFCGGPVFIAGKACLCSDAFHQKENAVTVRVHGVFFLPCIAIFWHFVLPFLPKCCHIRCQEGCQRAAGTTPRPSYPHGAHREASGSSSSDGWVRIWPKYQACYYPFSSYSTG